MKRFDERFTHLDGSTLRYCIKEMDLEGEWPDQHRKAILPYSLFDEALLYGPEKKSGKGLLDLDPPPRFRKDYLCKTLRCYRCIAAERLSVRSWSKVVGSH